jgi:hypothetical protein
MSRFVVFAQLIEQVLEDIQVLILLVPLHIEYAEYIYQLLGEHPTSNFASVCSLYMFFFICITGGCAPLVHYDSSLTAFQVAAFHWCHTEELLGSDRSSLHIN